MLHEHLPQSKDHDFLPRYVTFVIFVIGPKRTKADAATLRRMSAAILQLSNMYGRPEDILRRRMHPKCGLCAEETGMLIHEVAERARSSRTANSKSQWIPLLVTRTDREPLADRLWLTTFEHDGALSGGGGVKTLVIVHKRPRRGRSGRNAML